MHAEIVMIGTELLLGELVDTNASKLAQGLRSIGLDLYYKTTVGDNEARITRVLDLALDRSDVVITSGGLGPTGDDVTRQAVANATGRKLVYSAELERQIAEAQKKLASVNEKLRAAAVLTAADIEPTSITHIEEMSTGQDSPESASMTEVVERLANDSPAPITRSALKAKLVEQGFGIDPYFYTVIARLKAKKRITVNPDGSVWRAPERT